jgi:hypothetical protein
MEDDDADRDSEMADYWIYYGTDSEPESDDADDVDPNY